MQFYEVCLLLRPRLRNEEVSAVLYKLGRAVIGGLLFATVSTLFFVPAVYAGIHSWMAHRRPAMPDTPPLQAALEES